MAGEDDSFKALRGVAGKVFDLMFQTLTPEHLAGWLKAPLEQAAAHGDEGLAHALVDAGAAMGSALHNKAVRGGHAEMVDNLLEKGAAVNAEDVNGEFPLHVACRCGDPNMVRSLLRKGAAIDEFSKKEVTPLYLAAQIGQEAAVRALLTAGADVIIRGGGSLLWSVMHAAAHAGHVDVLRLLVDSGADVNDLDAQGDTPLHVAAFSGKVGAIRVLLEAGADVNARDNTDNTPLHVAILKSFHKAVRALFAGGADDNRQDDVQAAPSREHCAEVVDLLLRSGADETIVDTDGRTAADIVGQADEIGEAIVGGDRLLEDFRRAIRLLAKAPADRAWRRRGLLVLCRSHPTRVQLKQEDSQTDAPMTRRTRSRAKETRSELAGVGVQSSSISGVGEGGTTKAKDGGCGNWIDLIARVLGLAEEEVFRTIVGYL